MANNYTQASFTIPVKNAELTRERMEMIEEWITSEDESDLDDELFNGKAEAIEEQLKERRVEHGDLGFAWDVDATTLGLFHDESIDIEAAVMVAQIILDLDDNNDSFVATWADVCSKPRTNEFGGGAVAFNRYHAEFDATHAMAQTLLVLLKDGPR